MYVTVWQPGISFKMCKFVKSDYSGTIFVISFPCTCFSSVYTIDKYLSTFYLSFGVVNKKNKDLSLPLIHVCT